MIDLHCHSTSSDGRVSPAELPRMALELGLRGLALTDHDTTGGVEEFMAAGQAIGMRCIPGVELSVSEEGMSCHIVGLYVNPQCGELQEKLAKIVVWRNERNRKILQALSSLGKSVSLEEVEAFAGDDGIVGRPHFALAMVKHGYCASVDGAFKKYLGRGCPAYIRREAFQFKEAIQMLHHSGGLAIWAHPLCSGNMTQVGFERRLDAMKELGLDGVEAYYPTYSPAQTRLVLKLAEQKQLLVSGGTDYHGGGSHANIELGIGYGKDFQVPDDLLDKMESFRWSHLCS